MAKKALTFLIAGSLVAAVAPVLAANSADTTVKPTFYKDVLPILQQNCQACHRPAGLNMGGLIAPMSFTDYKSTRPWAKSIGRAIEAGTMPPWLASEEFHGVFANERTLTADERETLLRWAHTGASAGDPADAPEPIDWPDSGWAIGEPDLTLEMPETFLVEDDVEDLYQNFVVDLPVDEERWIKAVEFRPGSPVVHHIIGYVVEPGDTYSDGERGQVGGIAPGNDPDAFPQGVGYPVKPGSKFVFAMHYHKESGTGTAVEDRSTVGIRFYSPEEEAELSKVHIEPIGNGLFEIPPGQERWQVGSARVFERPIAIHYLMPHMHLRGKAARYVATYPDGRQEKLLEVPQYDFNWQTSYEYSPPKIMPAGTRIDVYLWYDNTQERAEAYNFNADRAVSWGGPTTDEMDLGWLSYTYLDEEGASVETPSAASGN